MSYLLTFTSAVPVTLSRDVEAHSMSLSPEDRTLHPAYKEGVDGIIYTPDRPRRNRSWINRPPRAERRQSCRKVNSRRDWSGELEESEYSLPFPVAVEETERGSSTKPKVSSRDESCALSLPRVDTSIGGEGLMLDVEGLALSVGQSGYENDSAVVTDSGETETSVTDSEWTPLSEEVEVAKAFF